MRMPFEEFRGGLVRFRAHNRKGTHVIARVGAPALRNLLCFSQRPTHGHDGVLMPLDPCFPGRDAFSFSCASVTFGKGVPGLSARTGLAAAEYGEIRIVRAHGVS